MKRILRFKKRTWVLTGVVAAIAAMASVGAYAYWTAGGSGSGTATAGSAAANLQISAAGWANLGIGDSGAKAVSVTVHNPNPYSSHVNNVLYTGITADAGHSGCLASWFNLGTGNASGYVAVNSVALNADLAADDAAAGGADETTTAGFGSLTLKDMAGVDQNACQGAILTLSFTSN